MTQETKRRNNDSWMDDKLIRYPSLQPKIDFGEGFTLRSVSVTFGRVQGYAIAGETKIRYEGLFIEIVEAKNAMRGIPKKRRPPTV